MFDKFFSQSYPSSSYSSHSHEHHEHRAPTDQSIQLLREMEAKAEQRVIERLTVSNVVKGTVVRRMSLRPFEHEMVISFELNGYKFQTAPVIVPEMYTFNRLEWVKKLHEEVAKAVAAQLLLSDPTTWELKKGF